MTENTDSIHKPTRNSRTITTEYRKVPGEHYHGRLRLRYDDSCGNGRNTFSIALETKVNSNYQRDSIRKVFPEYSNLLKWSMTSTDGPWGYMDALYHAEDKRIEAKTSLEAAKVKVIAYKQENGHLPCREHASNYTRELQRLNTWAGIWADRLDKAEGPDLKAARVCAVAPEATLEQLQDVDWLKARLPELIESFKADMDATFGKVVLA
jgi:hypothetical protein